jgi:hypothetical protein
MVDKQFQIKLQKWIKLGQWWGINHFLRFINCFLPLINRNPAFINPFSQIINFRQTIPMPTYQHPHAFP